MAKSVDLKELLAAGAHFGHKTSRWHPKMAPYIHSKRNGVHIIDLVQTAANLEVAMQFISETVAAGKQVMLVGTKRQAQPLIKELAEATNQPYVVERWMGGMLTNWNTISARVKRLKDLESRMESGELANRYNKLEVQRFQEEIDELNRVYGGVKNLNGKPGALFIIDIVAENNAVKEASRLHIPVVALVDTNADPTKVTYPIPANDDATKTITLMAGYIRQAIEEGAARHTKEATKTK